MYISFSYNELNNFDKQVFSPALQPQRTTFGLLFSHQQFSRLVLSVQTLPLECCELVRGVEGLFEPFCHTKGKGDCTSLAQLLFFSKFPRNDLDESGR